MPDQLAIPPRITTDGRYATVPQGSDTEVAQRVNVLCRTPAGWFDGRPGVGLQEDTFDTGVDVAEVDRQLRGLGPDVLYRITEDPSLMSEGLDLLGLEAGAA